jgi:hypothetical protein
MVCNFWAHCHPKPIISILNLVHDIYIFITLSILTGRDDFITLVNPIKAGLSVRYYRHPSRNL